MSFLARVIVLVGLKCLTACSLVVVFVFVDVVDVVLVGMVVLVRGVVAFRSWCRCCPWCRRSCSCFCSCVVEVIESRLCVFCIALWFVQVVGVFVSCLCFFLC